MWKFIRGDRSILKEYGFIRVTAFKIPRWEQNPEDCPRGGALYINDNENFFRVTDFCSGDDTVYISGHIATFDDFVDDVIELEKCGINIEWEEGDL